MPTIYDDIEEAQVARLTKAGPVYEVCHHGVCGSEEEFTLELYHGDYLKFTFYEENLDTAVSHGGGVWEIPVNRNTLLKGSESKVIRFSTLQPL